MVIVGQTVAWESGELSKIAGTRKVARHEVKPLTFEEARQALASQRELAWLASQSEALTALTNPRTLAWVIEAAARFRARMAGNYRSQPSRTRYGGTGRAEKVAAQQLLMHLGERDATFEHSFPVSTFDKPEVLDGLPAACPLRITDNRVRFDHDLAADWARFQRLKEDADEVAKWAHYAENPLWHAALRLLGQHLLRRSIGVVNGWDAAFARAEALGDTVPPLAADLLLDALFLDPTADARLEQRVEMLFENSGARLLRLLVRFEHVGTEPSISGAAEGPLGILACTWMRTFERP